MFLTLFLLCSIRLPNDRLYLQEYTHAPCNTMSIVNTPNTGWNTKPGRMTKAGELGVFIRWLPLVLQSLLLMHAHNWITNIKSQEGWSMVLTQQRILTMHKDNNRYCKAAIEPSPYSYWLQLHLYPQWRIRIQSQEEWQMGIVLYNSLYHLTVCTNRKP